MTFGVYVFGRYRAWGRHGKMSRRLAEIGEAERQEIEALNLEERTELGSFDALVGAPTHEAITRLQSRQQALAARFAEIEPIVKGWRCLAAR